VKERRSIGVDNGLRCLKQRVGGRRGGQGCWDGVDRHSNQDYRIEIEESAVLSCMGNDFPLQLLASASSFRYHNSRVHELFYLQREEWGSEVEELHDCGREDSELSCWRMRFVGGEMGL
jgi:hypothetical protein